MTKTQVFEKNKADIADLLYRLNVQCHALCARDPEKLDWAQVEEMGWMANQLRELVERN